MVARQELPGIGVTTDPSRRARYERVQLMLVAARIQLTVRPLSHRSLRDGTIGNGFQAVPARLPSFSPSGTISCGRSFPQTTLTPWVLIQSIVCRSVDPYAKDPTMDPFLIGRSKRRAEL